MHSTRECVWYFFCHLSRGYQVCRPVCQWPNTPGLLLISENVCCHNYAFINNSKSEIGSGRESNRPARRPLPGSVSTIQCYNFPNKKKSIFNSILCISFNFQYLPSLALSSQRQLVIVCFYLIFSPKVLVSYLLRAHGAWVQLFSVYFNISNAISSIFIRALIDRSSIITT